MSTSDAPQRIPYMNSELIKEGLVDRRCPLPLYVYSMSPRSQNMAVFHVLGLWGLEDKQQDEYVRTALFAQTNLPDKCIANVTQVTPPGDPLRPSCVIFGNDPEAQCLSAWLEKQVRSLEDRVRICCAVAHAVQVLHNNGIVNLPIHARDIHIENDGSVTLYPVGELRDRAPQGSSQEEVTGTFADAVESDLIRLNVIILELLGLKTSRECHDVDLKQILVRLGQETAGWTYESAATIERDLQNWLDGKTISWIHSSRVDGAKYYVRRHKKIAASVACFTTIASLLIIAITFLSIQNHGANLRADTRHAELIADQKVRATAALQLVAIVVATAQKRFESGDALGALSEFDGFRDRIEIFRSSNAEVARAISIEIASMRILVLKSNLLNEQDRQEVVDIMIADAQDAAILDWLAKHSKGYREEILAAEREQSSMSTFDGSSD